MARLFDDGATEYLEIESAVVTGPPFAFACWFYTDDLSNYQTVISLANSGAYNEFYILRLEGSGNNVQVNIRSSASNQTVDTTTTYGSNAWHHALGIVASATDYRVFLDGGGKGTKTTSVSPSGINRTSVGRIGDNTPGWYTSGRIAEAAIWDLSGWPGASDAARADEFERLAVSGLAKGYSPDHFPLGLPAYWRLVRDEDQDRQGSYDLTPYNTPSIATHPPMHYPRRKNVFVPSSLGGILPHDMVGGMQELTGGIHG